RSIAGGHRAGGAQGNQCGNGQCDFQLHDSLLIRTWLELDTDRAEPGLNCTDCAIFAGRESGPHYSRCGRPWHMPGKSRFPAPETENCMSIKSDHWIRRMALEHGMLEPFEPNQVREVDGRKVISYGTSSYGYDVRCANEF